MIRRSNDQWSTLADELDLVRSYLAIEEARHGDRLRARIEVSDELLELWVPSLALQPLVENALRHGVRAGDGAGAVELRASRAASVLQLAVLNDAPGLPDGWDLDRNAGCGLQAVEALLRRHGSAGGRLIVRDRFASSGTEARVFLPV